MPLDDLNILISEALPPGMIALRGQKDGREAVVFWFSGVIITCGCSNSLFLINFNERFKLKIECSNCRKVFP